MDKPDIGPSLCPHESDQRFDVVVIGSVQRVDVTPPHIASLLQIGTAPGETSNRFEGEEALSSMFEWGTILNNLE